MNGHSDTDLRALPTRRTVTVDQNGHSLRFLSITPLDAPGFLAQVVVKVGLGSRPLIREGVLTVDGRIRYFEYLDW